VYRSHGFWSTGRWIRKIFGSFAQARIIHVSMLHGRYFAIEGQATQVILGKTGTGYAGNMGTGYAGNMGTGYAGNMGTGYAIPNFPIMARTGQSPNFAHVPGNETTTIISGKLGIA
jgi:hypothetical protein